MGRIMNEIRKRRRMGERAQGNLVGLILGLLVAGIVVIDVFIPTINNAINSANLTGTTLTIVNLLPLFGALILLVALASPLMSRVG